MAIDPSERKRAQPAPVTAPAAPGPVKGDPPSGGSWVRDPATDALTQAVVPPLAVPRTRPPASVEQPPSPQPSPARGEGATPSPLPQGEREATAKE